MGLWGIFRIQIITRLVTQPLSLPYLIPSLSLSIHYLVFWVKFLITQNLLLGHKHQQVIYRNQEFRHLQETETKEDEKGNESLT